jgi:hypothetical protein
MRRIVTMAVVVVALLVAGPAATADGPGNYDGHNSSNGTVFDGSAGHQDQSPGSGTPTGVYDPSSPPAVVYEHFWTPACSPNGPPPYTSDVMCMAAASGCKYQGQPDAILMRHYRRASDSKTWEFVDNECRGPDQPARQEPRITQEMVFDQAYAAAPRPTAGVQPGNRSYVNLPNNYYADAPGKTETVTVLGHPIRVVFTVNQVTWDFGDDQSATGKGVKNADVGAPGAVEHAYARQGSYQITASTTVGVQFTLPDGQAVDQPNAFTFTSDAVQLPVGEIQTRVDSTD